MKISEFILAMIVLIALIGVQTAATHSGVLLHQVPWLDEVHTGILVQEPDAEKFHSAVSVQCVDANFPVYYQALRLLHITSLPAIRAVSLAGTIAMLLGIYVLLRPSFRICEAAVGVLTVWSIPLIVYHSLQARFYIPWSASIIWFAVAMRWTNTAQVKWLPAIAVAVTSILACTLHLLGLPAVGLIVLAQILADRGPLKTRVLRALPALAGAIAVCFFIPLIIEQKHSIAIKTWLVGNPIRLLYSTFTGIFPGVASSVLMLALLATAWLRRRDDQRPRDIWLKPLVGMSALAFYPLVLFAVTIVFQPVLLPRYALVTSAVFAAAAAFAASRFRKSIAVIVCAALIFESSAELSRRVREAQWNASQFDSIVSPIRAEPDVPALFESRHQLFPVVWVARDLVDRCAYVDFDPGPNQLDPVVEGFERDLAKKFERVFGWPHVMSWGRVMTLRRFILVPIDDDPQRVAQRFEGFHVERLSAKYYLLTRSAPATREVDESSFFELK
jgi:hypothetical protein